ncbi:MAG: hypothetical protein JOZ08_15620 [Verrucomicrobia bacterium]|nr:hypothetical protein [Verrucomicrobiota bacterium]
MKLRLQFNSIRLRLKRGEVERFASTGRVEEYICSGSDLAQVFSYVLEATDAVSSPTAAVSPGSVVVQVPPAEAVKWALTDQVGIEGEQATDNQVGLRISIEKDFACIDGTDEQNVDTFPNPLAGKSC